MSDLYEDFVIIDCDTGIDDAWALLMLIKGEKFRKYKILAITCVAGNTNLNNVGSNTLRILDSIERTDIPIYLGAHQAFIGQKNMQFNYHGNDGFGDLNVVKPISKNSFEKNHAVNAMYEFVCKYPKKITFFLIGPLTNFALCLSMYSDFAEKINEVYIMGGNIHGVGNVSKCAEFNFFFDPEAAEIVLKKAKCHITILPWETCIEKNDKLSIPIHWRLNVLGNLNKNAPIQLLNAVEQNMFKMNNVTNWTPCDAFLIAAYLYPKEMIKKESLWHASVELWGKHTRGEMVLDHLKRKTVNVRIIEEISIDKFKELAIWTIE